MATPEEVQKLAALARVSVDAADLERFTKEFDAIIAYVGQLETLEVSPVANDEKPPVRNVMRDDSEPHESGRYTEKLVAQFPEKKGNLLAVKQIISHE